MIEQLQGFEAAAGAWEADILPLRIPGSHRVAGRPLPGGRSRLGAVQPAHFDWGFRSREGHHVENVPISFGLREALSWLLNDPPEDRSQVGAAAEIMDFLDQQGASFVTDITSALRRLPSDVEAGLWHLMASA